MTDEERQTIDQFTSALAQLRTDENGLAPGERFRGIAW